MLFHNDHKRIKSKNVRKFTSRESVEEYLSNEVFLKERFIRHITETAKTNHVSYILAYNIITNHLIDILYEIDKAITSPRKKVLIRVYGYFSLRIGFMISSTRTHLIELFINQRKEKRNESK